MIRINPLPPLEEVQKHLRYAPDTGAFTWITGRQGRRPGEPAGHWGASGYLRIKIDRKLYHANRLAWLLVYGVDPDREVDHRDGDTRNNRISNLRLATHKENMRNRRIVSVGKSGFRGVYRLPSGSWRSGIRNEAGRKEWLGTFATPEAAAEAYNEAAKRMRGEFAVLNSSDEKVHDPVHDQTGR